MINNNIKHYLAVGIGISMLGLAATPVLAGGLGGLDANFGSRGTVITDVPSAYDRFKSMFVQGDGKIVSLSDADYTNSHAVLARHNSDGSADTSFGTNGRVTISRGTSDYFVGAVLQADGKIVVGGSTWNGTDYDFSVLRYMANGSADTGFGTGGKVTADFGGTADAIADIALQNGKIILGGLSATVIDTYNYTNNGYALVRLTENGVVDTTFGSQGRVVTQFTGSLSSIAVQGDGKIVALGEVSGGLGVARFQASGTIDSGFGTSGVVVTPSETGGGLVAADVALQADGKIVTLSFQSSANYPYIPSGVALVRYNTTGTLDSTFNGGHVLVSDWAAALGAFSGAANSLAIQSDGSILAAGTVTFYSTLRTLVKTSSRQEDFAVARYTANGAIDSHFGSRGIATVDFSNQSYDLSRGVAIQSDGKIVMGGSVTTPTGTFIGLARFLP